jgi:hypothetical protein
MQNSDFVLADCVPGVVRISVGLCDSASKYSSSLFPKRASSYVLSGGSVVHRGWAELESQIGRLGSEET